MGGRGAAEGNSKPCKPFSPTQYSEQNLVDFPKECCGTSDSPKVADMAESGRNSI